MRSFFFRIFYNTISNNTNVAISCNFTFLNKTTSNCSNFSNFEYLLNINHTNDFFYLFWF